MQQSQLYNLIKKEFTRIITENGLEAEEVVIQATPLSPEAAIGNPEDRDYPLIIGKERLMQAKFMGSLGQAFTDIPRTFRGKIEKILELRLTNNGERALFIATLNALMRYVGIINNTVHCKDKDPESCAKEMVRTIIDKYGPDIKIGIVGFQPAIIDNFSRKLFAENLKATDLDRDNINKIKYGISIWDGGEMTEKLDSYSALAED